MAIGGEAECGFAFDGFEGFSSFIISRRATTAPQVWGDWSSKGTACTQARDLLNYQLKGSCIIRLPQETRIRATAHCLSLRLWSIRLLLLKQKHIFLVAWKHNANKSGRRLHATRPQATTTPGCNHPLRLSPIPCALISAFLLSFIVSRIL